MIKGLPTRVRRRAAWGGAAVAVALVGSTIAAGASEPTRSPIDRGDEPAVQPIEEAPSSPAVAPDEAMTEGASALAATDLTYNTVDACRHLDTRRDLGHRVGRGQPWEGFSLLFTGFCGIPADGSVKAVMANIIVITTTGDGYVRQAPWPYELNLDATLVNFTNGPPNSNAVAIPICEPVEACDFEADFFVFNGAANVVIDVLGYFSA